MNGYRIVISLLVTGFTLVFPVLSPGGTPGGAPSGRRGPSSPTAGLGPGEKKDVGGIGGGASVKTGLQAFLDGKLPEEKLTIGYTDLHALWGGESITLDGSGKYFRKEIDRGGLVREARNNIDKGEIDKIVRIILEVEAWIQQVPAAAPVPDESRAWLRLRIGSDTSEIWERYNDLLSNHRVGRVKDALRVIGEKK